MKVPILTYHASDIRGNEYRESDLAALDGDLETIDSLGFRILPLSQVIDLWLQSPESLESTRAVALTCDDGTDFDFRDLPHPVAGMQRSVLNRLRGFRSRRPGAQPSLSITSFVIVSPSARAILDRTCLIGKGWWRDDWWQSATSSGLMEIASHSWDHNHDTLEAGRFPGVPRGSFDSIDTDELADFQIEQAAAFLRHSAPGSGAELFAYPYGKSNGFLVESYFPRRAEAIGVKAAFADLAEPLHRGSNRWALPRYVFRRDWKEPGDLAKILRESGS